MTALLRSTWTGRLLTASLAVALAGSVTSAASARRLRIATFNVEWLVADAAEATAARERGMRIPWDSGDAVAAHRREVARVIAALDADVVVLEEVVGQRALDALLATLREQGVTTMRGWLADAHDTTGQDVAVLSRLEPLVLDGQPLRRVPRLRARVSCGGERTFGLNKHALFAFEVQGWRIGVLGLHLRSRLDDRCGDAERTAQARLAQRLVREEILARDLVPIVAGDLNEYEVDGYLPDATPSLATSTRVLEMLRDVDGDGVPELRNAAERIASPADRWTYVPREHRAMIDHVLVGQRLWPHVVRAFVYRGAPGQWWTASDHEPMVVDLELP